MKKLLAAALTLLLVLSFLGCTGGQVDSEEFIKSGEYFKDYTLEEYSTYLYETFVSLYPKLPSYKDYDGVTDLFTTFTLNGNKASETSPSEGVIARTDGTLPVFYGLLWRAAEYEESKGVNNQALAEKYGKQHAVLAENVEKITEIIFRKEIPLSHGSTDGAEYIEEDKVYVFDELQDPYQEFADKGWELVFLPFEKAELDKTWGNSQLQQFRCCPVWFAENGEIYDPYGDLLYTLDEPTQRPESGESLLFHLNKAQQVQRPYSFITIAYQPEGNFSDYVLTLEEPIASVVIGTNRTTE